MRLLLAAVAIAIVIAAISLAVLTVVLRACDRPGIDHGCGSGHWDAITAATDTEGERPSH